MGPLKTKLDKDIFKNNKEYFFSFLVEKYEYATTLWKRALEKYFKKSFEPIFVLRAEFNSRFPHKNFIFINERLLKVQNSMGSKKLVFLSEYEDINKEFSESGFVRGLVQKLIKKQKRIFILPFSTVNLSFSLPNVFILGPNPKIAEKYDNKIEQKFLFDKLNLPRNKSVIFKNINEAKRKIKNFPVFLSAAFSSGGYESRVIHTLRQIDIFRQEMRKINRNNRVLAAPFIEDVILSPNSNAIVVGENKTIVNCISDQLLRAQAYLGNIYPSEATLRQKEIIIEATEKVGNYLSRQGFRGIFGLDFIFNKKGEIFVTDLNPRRQGGYLCHILAARRKIDIVDLELKIHLGNKIMPPRYNDFQVDFTWAHSKIKPYQAGQKIIKNFCDNAPYSPFDSKEKAYKAIFYPKNYIFAGGNAGYYITTGTNRNKILQRLKVDVDNIISDSLKSTSWKDYFDDPKTYDLIQ